jgi:hypothetical protein
MTPSPLPLRLLLCAAACACAGLPARAAERAPCTLSPVTDDMPADSADGKSLSLDVRKPVAFVNWSVRWHQRQRLWITLAVTNRGETPAAVRAEFATDLQPDGGRSSGLAAPAQLLAPHASATQRLALYVPEDAKTAAVLLHNVGPVATVTATVELECSDKRFDPGQMRTGAAALLDEALKLYSTGLADPIPNPQLALQTVRVQASGAQDATDVAWAMRYLMASLHDTHSTIRPPGEAAPPPPAAPPAAVPTLEWHDDIAVLRLPGTGSGAAADRQADASRLHELVAAASARRPQGWVVDLRQNGGGDLWTALAGLGALLQGPAVGAFVGHESHEEWIVERGAARRAGGEAVVDLQLPPEPPLRAPVAVLVGSRTAGAGEAIAVAFEGRPRTRFFGAPTQGRDDDAIVLHTLSDGTVLGVVGVRNADRNGIVYRGPIEPDKLLGASEAAPLPHEAVDWLHDQH